MGEILRDVNVEERRAARMMMRLGSGQKVNPACSSGVCTEFGWSDVS